MYLQKKFKKRILRLPMLVFLIQSSVSIGAPGTQYNYGTMPSDGFKPENMTLAESRPSTQNAPPSLWDTLSNRLFPDRETPLSNLRNSFSQIDLEEIPLWHKLSNSILFSNPTWVHGLCIFNSLAISGFLILKGKPTINEISGCLVLSFANLMYNKLVDEVLLSAISLIPLVYSFWKTISLAEQERGQRRQQEEERRRQQEQEEERRPLKIKEEIRELSKKIRENQTQQI